MIQMILTLVTTLCAAATISRCDVDDCRPHEASVKLRSLMRGKSLFIVHRKAVSLEDSISPASPELRLSSSGASTLISDLNMLTGCLKIDTAEKALEYVRLRSNDLTWRCWTPRMREVRLADSRNLVNRLGEGYDGLVWSKNVSNYASFFPTVELAVDHYKILRLMIVEDSSKVRGQAKLVLVQELVGINGEYSASLRKQEGIPASIRSIRWKLPLNS